MCIERMYNFRQYWVGEHQSGRELRPIQDPKPP
jgi:hypothetical protein